MKHLRYLSYVLRHKWFVLVECWKRGLYWRGLTHDLSKFRPSEWFPYTRYFYGNYPEWAEMSPAMKSTWTSRTREDVSREFNLAWLLHQHRNPHHWQYWILRNDDGGSSALPMPPAYRTEMLCDWIGAGKAQIKPWCINVLREWYAKHRDIMVLHPETREWIEERLGVALAS